MDRKGFSPIGIILLIVLITLIGAGILFFSKKSIPMKPPVESSNQTNQPTKAAAQLVASTEKSCQEINKGGVITIIPLNGNEKIVLSGSVSSFDESGPYIGGNSVLKIYSLKDKLIAQYSKTMLSPFDSNNLYVSTDEYVLCSPDGRYVSFVELEYDLLADGRLNHQYATLYFLDTQNNFLLANSYSEFDQSDVSHPTVDNVAGWLSGNAHTLLLQNDTSTLSELDPSQAQDMQIIGITNSNP